MKTTLSSIIIFFLFTSLGFSQKYITKSGYIKFYSDMPVETIEAQNRLVNCALDISTGDIVFRVLIKSFEFEKALMQEHFNENYMESAKFPSATFTGKIINPSAIDFKKEGTYTTEVEGDMTIHGVTRKIREKGTFEVGKDKIMGKAKFIIKPADYDIKIPKAVIQNIAEEIEVTVDVPMEQLMK